MIEKLNKASTALVGGVAALTGLALGGCGSAAEPTGDTGKNVESNGTQPMNARQYAADRNVKMHQIADWLSENPSDYEAFKSDPNTVAARFGVRFTPEEIVAIKTTEALPDATQFMRCVMDKETTAFFDGNCGCGGGGTCGW